ncbi:Bug family tripartite tricarboxylate transporter substrate binding protein [Paralcaligenes sp. KSB-10]|uniref:Bug family tripartite tricarboxylate transporter substrate binding protein n=1 Tax=Paralcaligenes sp. KSB-10 TaxID=2901142 RepID=UPI00351D665D
MFVAASMAVALPVFTAQAGQQWPAKPFKVVVPYPAGGSADIIGRLIAKKLSEKFDQHAIVDNLSGGATVPGALAVLREPADGYTLFMASDNTLNINTHLMKKLPYDGDKDFTPITVVNTYPHWLIVSATSRYKNFSDFKHYIEMHPNKVSISVNTIGGAAYLALSNWRQENHLNFEIIPYRGSPPAVSDLIGGQTDAHVDVVGSSISYVKGGKVRPIAVLQSTPLKEFPDAETQNYDDPKALTVRSNLSVVVKKGTPKEVIDKLYAAIKAGVQEPDFVQALDLFKYAPVLTPPEQAAQFLKDETVRYGKLVQASGLQKQ